MDVNQLWPLVSLLFSLMAHQTSLIIISIATKQEAQNWTLSKCFVETLRMIVDVKEDIALLTFNTFHTVIKVLFKASNENVFFRLYFFFLFF